MTAMARELALSGFRSPVIVAAGGCHGEKLAQMLLDALDAKPDQPDGKQTSVRASDESKLAPELLIDLLNSGCLAVIVDGVIEFPIISNLAAFIAEINELTKPSAVTSHSLWIVSSRKYDYNHFSRGAPRAVSCVAGHALLSFSLVQ